MVDPVGPRQLRISIVCEFVTPLQPNDPAVVTVTNPDGTTFERHVTIVGRAPYMPGVYWVRWKEGKHDRYGYESRLRPAEGVG